ncbi:Metallo-hydrolase/oxidoreductase [Athelia psychrophila]|uniref:Metallo-hydrolase/oxidoreductase n=1 Tax=Athelia psychrophila TaxID=1759441 RepID=A0A166CV72_9AGAM|nr:Metallo-hydrolase/oxidoreductase [Fibularhizoctonia sp. CBS 109695]
MAAATILVKESQSPRKEPKPTGRPAHHLNGTQSLFTNPWPSVGPKNDASVLGTMWAMLSEWKSKPMPPKEEWVRVERPTWGLPAASASAAENDGWARDIKATWLGHACFLVELPAPPSSPDSSTSTSGADIGAPARGPRVLFDPVFSHRCSPSQYFGPKRLTPPPLPLRDLPHVDVVVLSHNHYDHTDTATLQHIYAAQPKGSVHFFCALGNLAYFKSLGFDTQHVTEMDWWDARDATISFPSVAGKGEHEKSTITVTCTPAQHFSGRGLTDRMHTLWASWAIEQRPYTSSSSASTETRAETLSAPISKVWFGGDTGFRAVPANPTPAQEKDYTAPTCPVFAEIGTRFGGFDLAFIPIGAFSPRGAFSPVHASPADAVVIHKAVRSRRSIGMHWGCWALSDEVFSQDPERLREACEEAGVADEFGTGYVGETVRQAPA